nr:hypothetical protein Iba_chr10dCG3960 [Ipomoea batatas]
MFLVSTKNSIEGSCKDINHTTVSLSPGTIYIVRAKQKRMCISTELQNGYGEVRH